MQRWIGLGLVLVGVAQAAPSLTEREQATRQQLQQLKTTAQTQQRQLRADTRDYQQYSKQLEQLERQIQASQQRLAKTLAQQQQLDLELQQLQQRQQHSQQQLQHQQQQLALMLKASFIHAERSAFKWLLQAQDPALEQRVQVYRQYFAQSRQQLMTQIGQQQQQQAALQQQVISQQARLESLQQQQQQALQALEKDQQQRAALVRASQKKRDASQLQWQKTQLQQTELTGLLTQLTRKIEQERQAKLEAEAKAKAEQAKREAQARAEQQARRDAEAQAEQAKRAAQARPQVEREVADSGQTRARQTSHRTAASVAGRSYPWPVAGKPARRQSGVFIATAAGTPVASIAAGKILFADWLKGFGLLVIVDHGDGVMSLYGHNQQVTQLAGESVKAGTILGMAGNTGGLEQPGVYFEVRQQGVAEDPFLWCR